MRNLTKASREASRNAQFDYLVKNGYTRETYKGLDFFSKNEGKYFTLKVYRGTAANAEHFVNYRTEERRAEIIQNFKNNYDSREEYKAEQKIKNNGKLSSHAATAAAIREELKKNFSGVKFSVTSESFAGGDSCHISWTDGPTRTEVEAITGKYQYGSFDGMTDCYNYTNSREDIPQVKYVSESRSISEEIEKIVIAGLMALKTYNEEELNDFSRTGPKQQARYILSVTTIPLGYTEAKVITDENDSFNYFKLIFTTPEQPKAKQPQGAEATEAGEVKIVDYSEKAFAVIGDFSAHYDNLINLGGKYNKFLKCGRGIIFSKTKLEAVKNYFESITPQEQGTEEPKEQESQVGHPQREEFTPHTAPNIPTPDPNILPLEYFTILWHEGRAVPDYNGQTFRNWDEVQTAFFNLWEANEKGEGGGYTKVKIKIKITNSDEHTNRIDITDKVNNGDFNPSQMHIVTYLQSIMNEQDEQPTQKEGVEKFSTLDAITQAAENGEGISLLNLCELINQKKSPECSHFLQTMDSQEDPNYHEATKETLEKYPNTNLKNLETELNKYI